MANDRDPTEVPSTGRFGRPDTTVEHIADDVMNVVVPGFDEKAERILEDMDAEAAADEHMLETEERLMRERSPVATDGVDLGPVQAVDQSFDGQQFLTIARDAFDRVREAQTRDNPHLADAELSLELMAHLREDVAGDLALHRHRLLPGLEIRRATITSATVADGEVTLVVDFHLMAEEIEVDDRGTVLAGDFGQQEWDERWTFRRDPAADDADDVRTFMPFAQGGWLVAHRGWIVTAIERLGPPDSLDPSEL